MAVEEKLELRRAYVSRRDGLSVMQRAELSRRIGERLLGLEPVRTARRVALYAAIGSEVATSSLFPALHVRGVRLLYPRVRRGEHTLDFCPVDDPAELTPGAFGIPEPHSRPEGLVGLDVVVVPGIAFDRHGVRLGSGAGYYDRALATFQGCSVGLAFECQIAATLPRAPHDKPMNWVVTETQAWQS